MGRQVACSAVCAAACVCVCVGRRGNEFACHSSAGFFPFHATTARGLLQDRHCSGALAGSGGGSAW